MRAVLEEIAVLRGNKPIIIDYRNSNRYRLVVQEDASSKTGYYFSTPIYNRKDRRMIDMRFRRNGNAIYASGSNANITVLENIHMENAEGSCVLELQQSPTLISDKELCGGNIHICLTCNGVMIRSPINEGKFDFVIEAGEPFLNVRANDKYFALMKERFRPLVVFSCIGSVDAVGNVTAPAKMEYQKLTDKKYRLTVSAASPLAQFVMFEANLYENKLFQDTTVESNNPAVNNAFGSIGFIGNTAMYGEQWLYSRLDYSRMSELMDKSIQNVILHIPKLNQSKVELRAFQVKARFCSFGSNWDNKIGEGAPISDSTINSRYQSIKLTPLLVDPRTKLFIQSEGVILKPKIRGSGFSVIGTGDSYLAPQILEINYR